MRTFGLALLFCTLACTAMAASRRRRSRRAVPPSARLGAALGLLLLARRQRHARGHHRRSRSHAAGGHRRPAVHGRRHGQSRRDRIASCPIPGGRCSGTWSPEADRLGLEINLNNDPGWAGSGGPWIKPEQAAAKSRDVGDDRARPGALRCRVAPTADDRQLLSRHRRVGLSGPAGGRRRPVPPHRKLQLDEIVCRRPGFCRLRALAARDSAPIPTGRSFPRRSASRRPRFKTSPTGWTSQGHLKWDAPAGRWLVLRIGHTVAGGVTRSAQAEANGWECDKLSKAAVETQFCAHGRQVAGRRRAACRQDDRLHPHRQLGGRLGQLDRRLPRRVPPPPRLRPAAVSADAQRAGRR